jgi:hypothetical protein
MQREKYGKYNVIASLLFVPCRFWYGSFGSWCSFPRVAMAGNLII